MARNRRRFEKRSQAYSLAPTDIDLASQWVVDNLMKARASKSDCLRMRLLFEEALLDLAAHGGNDQQAVVYLSRRQGKYRLRLVVKGPQYNPLKREAESEQDYLSLSLFSVIDINVHYSYTMGQNVLRMSLPRPSMNPVLKIVIAILLGGLVGVAGNVFIPDALQESISNVILAPIGDMWVRLLQAISGPIIFLTAMTATFGTGRIVSFGSSRILSVVRYFVISALVVVFTMLCALPIFSPEIAMTEANGYQLGTVLDGVLQIIPSNLIEPFTSANTPQLLLIAVATGYLLASTDSRLTAVKTLVQQLNVLGLIVAQQACNLVPFFVGLLLYLNIWTHDVDFLLQLWVPLALSIGIALVVLAVMILAAAVHLRVRPLLLARKLWGQFAAAIQRGSINYASVDGLANSCNELLGIDVSFSRAALPQGLVLYMPVSAVGICVFVIFAAIEQGVAIDQMWLLSAAALSVVLAVATPPLTGANLLSFIMAFSYLGISSDAMLEVMIFDIIFGVLCVAFDQAALQIDTMWQAKRIGLLDEDVLRAPLARD